MYANILSVLSAIAVTGALALPTGTTVQPPSNTVSHTGVTHTVVAGLAGLHFDPDNVVANIGDIVEYHYLPKNHSVVQSSFDKPCVPINDYAIFSGFVPVTEGQSVSFHPHARGNANWCRTLCSSSLSRTPTPCGSTVLRRRAPTARREWPASSIRSEFMEDRLKNPANFKTASILTRRSPTTRRMLL
jgi:plastocyanin